MDTPGDTRVTIEILSGSVLLGQRRVELPPEELEVLVGLGLLGGTSDAESLAEMLHPDRDPGRASLAVSAAVRRICGRFGTGTISSSGGTYRLRGNATVDIDRLVRRVRANACRIDALAPAERDELVADAARLVERRPAITDRWRWFAALNVPLERLGHDVLRLTAEKLLAQRSTAEALRVIRIAIAADACNEDAREIAMRALALLNRSAAAVFEFQRYERLLQERFGLQPSFRLRECYRDVLLQTAVERTSHSASSAGLVARPETPLPALREHRDRGGWWVR